MALEIMSVPTMILRTCRPIIIGRDNRFEMVVVVVDQRTAHLVVAFIIVIVIIVDVIVVTR